jgi:alkanesulfonate monooxygenase SsuD/methylene tetrahydromethanopterin reductase-like flavin-dependent oxidoreductase (luciferase family)
MFRLHVDDTEEKAYETGRKLIEGVGNVFLDGSNGKANVWAQNLAGLNPRKKTAYLPTIEYDRVAAARGVATGQQNKASTHEDTWKHEDVSPEEHTRRRYKIWDSVLERKAAIVGTPDSVIPQVRHVLERLRPGNVFFWHGDGDMTHEESMRGIRHFGEYVLPAVRDIGDELGLKSAFEIDPKTNQPIDQLSPQSA